ncbi:hypothetical protein QTP86_016661 [Hemibagrus guttatus]|nr:hypothetical protein QTP86_016661 [Hemibagrus guttatus]
MAVVVNPGLDRSARRMDPATSASGGPPLQITSPITDPAELRDIVVRQGTIIRSYQDQVAALQTQLSSASIAAPCDPPSAREWASAVWDADPQVKSSFACFAGMIREVFEYPVGGKDISLQLMELRQGSETAADYAIRFRTLAAQSGWNDAALWAVFCAGLDPGLQAELACHVEVTSLSQFMATSIRLDNLRRQHRMGTQASAPARPRVRTDYPVHREEVTEPMQLGRSRLAAQGHRPHALIDSGAAVNLIDGALVEELGIPTFPCLPSLRITAIDSQPIGEGYLKRQTELLDFRVGLFHHEQLAFYVTSSPANPVILGFPWLRRHDPQISWRSGELVCWSPTCLKECLRDSVPRPCRTSRVDKATPAAHGHLPHQYMDFLEVFSEERAARLPSHQVWDCAIDLLPNTSLPMGRIYPLSLPESKAMEEYIETALAAGHIRPSTSSAAAGFFFVGKRDGGLRPCIDYRGLNAITVRYSCTLPLVPAALEQLRGARVFSKLDLRSAYNLVRIREGDEWKTAFHITSGHYEYCVMPFGLTNAPAVFQALINGVFQDLLGKGVIAYIADILVYSSSMEEHVRMVREVLCRLQQHHLYVKLEKCEFLLSTVTFLGYVISRHGVEMDVVKVQAVTEWPCSYLGVGATAFPWLRQLLPEIHPELQFGGRSVDVATQGKLTSAEVNYDVGNRELLAIKAALEEWRHWLEGARHPFQVLTDHRNLEYLRGAKRLNPWQASTNFIPDRSRPGLTTTAIGAVDLQGAGGNWATVGRRSRGGRRVHRQREKRKGKGRELADMMERRKVDILCVQETRWKGSKARSIGAGFKLFYYGVDSKRNGVGVVLKEELVGCELEEKERFWSELDEVMESIPTGERVVIGADFNGHVGEGNTGDEEVMGKFGVKERNLEGQMVVDFAKRMDMAVVNTYFQKREEHRVTYKSGGRRTQKKRQKLRQALGGQVVLPDDWETTAEVIRETGRKDSIQRKRLAKKKWDMDRLDTREGEKDLYRLARQRDRDGKDVQQEVDKIRKDEVRKALKRMKSGKAVGPDDIPVEVWKCLGEAAVEFLTSLFNRVLENLEKAYDRVPREELWYCMRKSGVAEKYVRVVQDMYERSRTVVRCAVVMDQLSEEVRQESPWTMMFADDIVICSESREQVEENLERWRFALERRGMKVSRSKTEYMCVNEREGSGTVRLQGEEVKKVQEFKYLGSTVQSNGECGKEVKKRVQAGWNGWRKVSGVLCDRKISARIKRKVYRTVVRAAMLYGLETVSLRKRQESELEVAELKMLRFSLGVTRLDRIRNEYIRGTAHVGRLGDKVREARLRWFGHVQRRESEYIGRRMLDMELPGRRQRGRPKRRYMDVINEDMKLVGASVEDAEDRDSTLNFIPDESRSGLTTTAIGAVDLQGASGNWDTVGRRSRGGRRLHRQREKRKGKGRKLADMMERRKVDILCVQETRWKGSKARSIGAGFKLFYYGVDSKRNGVVVVLKEEFVRNVLEVGCELEEKERFWSELDEVMESIPTGERVVIGADFNGHVGEGNRGDEEVMGKFGVKERNLEGQMVVDFANRMDIAVVNTYFQKREEHRVTYKSGSRRTQNRQEYKELRRRVKREVSKTKQKAYDELYTRLDTREGEKDLYRLARQRDRDGKDVQQARVIKDRDGRVLTSEESVQRRWKEYFEELMNEENEREKRVEGVNSVEQKVDKIRKDEARKALKRMKNGKAVGPDDILVEVWKCLGEAAVEFLTSLFNRVLESERMPEEWRRSVLVPIFKKKGDVQSCSNYRGIKLMSHTMKLWETVVEAKLRKVVEICEQQYGFMPRKSTTDAIFALRISMEKYRDGQRELHCLFVDLEKAYDRVPREELWYCMRKSGVAEKYVRVVQDMYERSRTVVRFAVGQTEEFKVEVGLHQGSALSPFLFAIVMDQLSEEVRQESPWTMMFADDIVICSESRDQVEENLERWRFALERRGMKVSRSKTDYMCVNEREGSGTVRLQGKEVKKVQEFKYLGSTVQSNGECGKEIKKRGRLQWVEKGVGSSV